MNITNVKIRRIFTEESAKVKAIASVIVGGDLAVHDLKVIQGTGRLFVAMPNRRSDDGSFQDIVHPINQTAREKIETAILDAYRKAVEQDTEPEADKQ
jgi:stage V sporulation protein G